MFYCVNFSAIKPKQKTKRSISCDANIPSNIDNQVINIDNINSVTLSVYLVRALVGRQSLTLRHVLAGHCNKPY